MSIIRLAQLPQSCRSNRSCHSGYLPRRKGKGKVIGFAAGREMMKWHKNPPLLTYIPSQTGHTTNTHTHTHRHCSEQLSLSSLPIFLFLFLKFGNTSGSWELLFTFSDVARTPCSPTQKRRRNEGIERISGWRCDSKRQKTLAHRTVTHC